MRGAARRREAEFAQMKWMGWHIAALPLAKKFPPLATFMGGDQQRAQATTLLQRAQAMHMYYKQKEAARK